MSHNDHHDHRRPVGRTLARERALQALYQIDLAGADPLEALRVAWGDEAQAPDAKAVEFAEALVCGVLDHRADLDAAIERYSHRWRIDRMSRIDRNILRLATFELTKGPALPVRVVLNEAIELAKRFGADDSSAFINGILDRVAAEVAQAPTSTTPDDAVSITDSDDAGADADSPLGEG
ncbi:MAG: transcription antitermination factor NusB [Myxococcales bacterium]|jgi:N utilization substance protein B|nr:transcription antitermination factor NusB [Myxococcales bacterium]